MHPTAVGAVTVLARTLGGHLRRLPWTGGLLATSPRPDHQRRRHRLPRAARARRVRARRRVRGGGGRAARGRERGQRVGEGRCATGDGGVRLHRREIPALPGVEAYAVEAHPAFIVHASGRGWLDPQPDIVLSGVNYGANVGRAVLHSGTVGAALTASLHGWRGLAVSLDSGWEIPEHPHWDAVAHVLPQVLDVLLAADEGTVLSVNVPDRPAAELGALREARLSRVRHGDDHRAAPRRGRRRRAARHRRRPGDRAGPRVRRRAARRGAPHGDAPDVGGRHPGSAVAVCDPSAHDRARRADSAHARSRPPGRSGRPGSRARSPPSCAPASRPAR